MNCTQCMSSMTVGTRRVTPWGDDANLCTGGSEMSRQGHSMQECEEVRRKRSDIQMGCGIRMGAVVLGSA